MKSRVLFTSLIIVALFSCQDSSYKRKVESPQVEKKEFYQSKMIEKNFSLISNGPCDDALDDTLHERSIVYIDSKIMNDSSATIDFKFKDACCQEFLGDFEISKDSLIFELEQVNDVVCACICWYRYKLVINKPEENFTEIDIKGPR